MKATQPRTCYSCWLFNQGNPHPCRSHAPRLKTIAEVRALLYGNADAEHGEHGNDALAIERHTESGCYSREEEL